MTKQFHQQELSLIHYIEWQEASIEQIAKLHNFAKCESNHVPFVSKTTIRTHQALK